MATLKFDGKSYTVDHAVKGTDYVHGYSADGTRVVSIDGVTDFSSISYTGTYMSPADCITESCNDIKYCGGTAKTRDGRSVPHSAVGAAPAGYVDGTYSVSDFYAAEPILHSELSTFEANIAKRYIFHVSSWTGYDIPPGDYQVVVYKEANGFALVKASNTTAQLQNCLVGGEWREWEWINPPMTIGVEYRTIRRIAEKPVYTKFFNMGSCPVGETSVKIADNVGTWAHIVALTDASGNDITISGYVNHARTNAGNIVVNMSTATTLLAAVEYIKSTD